MIYTSSYGSNCQNYLIQSREILAEHWCFCVYHRENSNISMYFFGWCTKTLLVFFFLSIFMLPIYRIFFLEFHILVRILSFYLQYFCPDSFALSLTFHLSVFTNCPVKWPLNLALSIWADHKTMLVENEIHSIESQMFASYSSQKWNTWLYLWPVINDLAIAYSLVPKLLCYWKTLFDLSFLFCSFVKINLLTARVIQSRHDWFLSVYDPKKTSI